MFNDFDLTRYHIDSFGIPNWLGRNEKGTMHGVPHRRLEKS